MLFEELNDQNIYDGIWACASILHLSKNDLFLVFHKMNKALKENGIIYTSFKYGEFEGERNGRYFTDFTEDSLKEFICRSLNYRSKKYGQQVMSEKDEVMNDG